MQVLKKPWQMPASGMQAWRTNGKQGRGTYRKPRFPCSSLWQASQIPQKPEKAPFCPSNPMPSLRHISSKELWFSSLSFYLLPLTFRHCPVLLRVTSGVVKASLMVRQATQELDILKIGLSSLLQFRANSQFLKLEAVISENQSYANVMKIYLLSLEMI